MFRHLAVGLGVLIAAAPALADSLFFAGGFSYEGVPTPPEITVPLGAPFTLDLHAIVFADPPTGVSGYDIMFQPPGAGLEFTSWTDATGGVPLFAPFPHFVYVIESPIDVPVVAEIHLGSIAFTPVAIGDYTVDLDPGSSLWVYPPAGTIPLTGSDPVLVHVGPGGPPPGAIAPPPVPPAYHMGQVTNGDFEAGGGSLSGWSTSAWPENSSVQAATLQNSHTDHVAHLHAEGRWEVMMGPGPGPGPEPGPDEWDYWAGEASLSQTVYVPVDATELTFVYTTRETVDPLLGGDPHASVRLGSAWSDWHDLPDADWTSYSLAIPEEKKGRRVSLSFRATDDGWGWSEMEPGAVNTMDLYVDYVGLDGTTVLQTTTWAAAGGGSWGNPANWSPDTVPDNSVAAAHDVVIPETAAGGAITLATARTVQTLNLTRQAGPFQVLPGGGLTVVEQADVAGGTLTIHPAGNAAGGTALTVGEALTFKANPADSSPSTFTVQDAVVQAKRVYLKEGAACVLQGVLAAPGETRLVGTERVEVHASTLTLYPGTAVVTPYLYVGSGGTVTVQDAAIADMSPGYTSNYGTVQFTGTCLVDQDDFYNSEILTFTDADVTFTGDLYAADRTTLTGSSVAVLGDLQFGYSASARLSADSASTLNLAGRFMNANTHGDTFDMLDGTVRFVGAGLSWMDVAGLDAGPLSSGLLDNFGLGTLAVDVGTARLRESGSGHAQYVRDLVVATGATLDLNGISLYYLNSATVNGAVTNGEVIQAYSRPAGLPGPGFSTYTATADANDSQEVVVDGPAGTDGYRWGGMGMGMGMEAYAESDAWVETGEGFSRVRIEINGYPGEEWDEWGCPMWWIHADASGRIEDDMVVPPTEDYPAGTTVEMLILAGQWGDAGYSLDWECVVSDASGTLATLAPGSTQATLSVVIGVTSLHVNAWMSDLTGEYDWEWGEEFDDHLAITFTTVPEPATLALLALGGLGVLAGAARRRRKA